MYKRNLKIEIKTNNSTLGSQAALKRKKIVKAAKTKNSAIKNQMY